MKLIDLSIKRVVLISMVYILIVGFGIYSLTQLKIDLYPDMDFPIVAVITTYSGAGPEDMENLVTRPIEEAVVATENVKNVTSSSAEGSSIVMLEFNWGTDMDQADTNVRNNIDFVRDYLPDDASDPLVFKFDPSLMPIMFISLSNDNMGPAELLNLSEDRIEALLERVDGVAAVSTMGGLRRQINVNLDPILMAANMVNAQQITGAIGATAGLMPAGNIDTATKSYNIRVYSEYRTLEQIENVIVGNVGGKPVKLSDVASVEDDYAELHSNVRVDGTSGVTLIVQKQSDANTVLACKGVKKELNDILKLLPQGSKFNLMFDQSQFIQDSVNNLSMTAVLAFLICCVVIYLFLRNLRGSIIMAISMPVSVIFTFAVLYVNGLTLNIISMAGLALAVGMLVDNSVVVLENIYRHREEGYSKAESASLGASEVSNAIVASTITTIAVFLPVLFVPGITGQIFGDMVITITCSLAVSLVVALTLVPMVSSRLIRTQAEKKNQKQNALLKSLNSFFTWLELKYKHVLHWAINNKRKVLIAVMLLFFGSLGLIPVIGGEFMPEADQGHIQIYVEGRVGIPYDELEGLALQVENALLTAAPETDALYLRYGAQEGLMAFDSASNNMEIHLKLKDASHRNRSQKEIEDSIRENFSKIAGISYNITQGNMMGDQKAIVVKLIGNDLAKGEEIANQIYEKMQKVKGFVDIEKSIEQQVPQLEVNLNQDVLNEYGLSSLQIASIISYSIQGVTAQRFREEGDEYNIHVQLDKKYRNDRAALESLLIPTMSGVNVPLRQLATIEETIAPPSIQRENQERLVSVNCNLTRKTDLNKAKRYINEILDETPIPSEFTVLIGGQAEDQQESNFWLLIAFAVAIVLVYMVMASQFESLIDPFIIFFTIPLSLIGVFLMLFITGTKISIMSLVGVVMLVGIAVNNGIVLVDYINQLRQRGLGVLEAVEKAGAARMRPVLMTAFTTIFGMVPLALEMGSGAELWAPLARSVIGGLFSTTILTLVVIPVIYIVVEYLGNKHTRKRMKGVSEET
ncbi:MAG: efflux RND transporter permease subunit [Candidatus Cloacimonetes bacterium]|nr:efflux RND transporter permease subunit [Candidatus Cloacimonadota bacterium]